MKFLNTLFSIFKFRLLADFTIQLIINSQSVIHTVIDISINRTKIVIIYIIIIHSVTYIGISVINNIGQAGVIDDLSLFMDQFHSGLEIVLPVQQLLLFDELAAVLVAQLPSE